MCNRQELDTSDAIAEGIEENIEAVEECNREAKEQLGFVAPVKGGDENGRREGESKKQKTTSRRDWRLLQLLLENWPQRSTVRVKTRVHANKRTDRQRPKPERHQRMETRRMNNHQRKTNGKPQEKE